MTMKRVDPARAASLVLVVGIHAAALWGLWQQRLIPSPVEVATLFVNFIAPPSPNKAEPKAPPPKPVTRERPQPRQLVAEAPVLSPADYVAPPPPPQPVPVIEAPAAPPAPPTPSPAGPVAMSSELAVACPERAAPSYPAQSRKLGEQGTVVLRVELDESGHVAVVRVDRGSDHARLDEAAIAAIRTWRCNPATRNGRPVRATALQPIKFVLQGN